MTESLSAHEKIELLYQIVCSEQILFAQLAEREARRRLKAGFNPDEPRDDHGRWTDGGYNAGQGSGDFIADDSGSNAQNAQPIPNNSAAYPVDVALSNGSTVINPNTGMPLQMPNNVSLQANIDFGEKIANWPSAMTGDSSFDNGYAIISPDLYSDTQGLPDKEAAMIAAFAPGGTMDYQRIDSSEYDANGNPVIDRQYIDFGNYNYGVVAAAAGYSYPQTLFGAAMINNYHALSNGNIDTSGPYGSNFNNNALIAAGYNAYKDGGLKGSGR